MKPDVEAYRLALVDYENAVDEAAARLEARLLELIDPTLARWAEPRASLLDRIEAAVPIESSGQGSGGPLPEGDPAPTSYTCDRCSATFTTPQGLGRHRAWKHDAGPKTPSPLLRKGREVFLCDRCTESFSTRSQRDKHRATHKDPAPSHPVGRALPRNGHEAAQAMARGDL